jgi:hypothetical protein
MKRLLVTGSRDWTNEAKVAFELGQAVAELSTGGEQVMIVHGGASGVDSMVHELARTYGIPTEVHPAPWRPYGIYNPQAGRYRNQLMVDLGADLCLAFIKANSTGASHCAQAAEDAGIPMRIYRES